MNEVALILADCPDAVTITFGTLTTAGIYLLRSAVEEGGGRLGTNLQQEILVIAEGEFPGLKRGDSISFVRKEVTNNRKVTLVQPKDDDPELLHVSVEKV